jgi:WD40 repeat protein
VWDVPQRKRVALMKYDEGGLTRGNSFALAPDGKSWIHTANNSDGARLLSLPDCKRLGDCAGPIKVSNIETASYHPSVPVVSPTGKWLAYAQTKKTNERSIRVFELATRKMVYEMPFVKLSAKESLDPLIASIAFAPDEKMLLVLDDHRGVHGYNLETGTFQGAFVFDTPKRLGNEAKTVLFTSDGQRVVIGCDNYVKIWQRDALPLKKE